VVKMRLGWIATALCLVVLGGPAVSRGQFTARDPGVRGGAPDSGGMLPGLSPGQQEYFRVGEEVFAELSVLGNGLGPRFNLDSCGGCHAHPVVGGSSPAINPQVALATAFGARNAVPPFVVADGPVTEARFRYDRNGERDGGVHALFVISGRQDGTGDARGCRIEQDDFATQYAAGNVGLRIPTPLFGAGLIEHIPDRAIVAALDASAAPRAALGIGGRLQRLRAGGEPHRNGNDGTIGRFGWKAQNKSLLVFSGEAYNVEQGVTNEMFPTERDETTECLLVPSPNDGTNPDAATPLEAFSDLELFAFFMRFLAPPAPSPTTPGGAASIARGRTAFAAVGCALCHTPSMRTGWSTVAALDDRPVNLYSDLALHRMGGRLADDIVQGGADGDEFRTAPLWGLGQRLFFLHDGRTRDLREAIELHAGGPARGWKPSEATTVIDRFRALPEADKQDLLNFLRSL
jgi:CxxC motif-containing protein (DUF1111 family)